MKVIQKIIGVVLMFLMLNTIVFAQSFNTDPTISTQNYKHPNKAKKAERKQSASVVKEEYVRTTNSYKASNLLLKRIPITVAINYSWQKDEIQRNYKQSFKPRPGIDRDEQIRKFLKEMSAKNEEEDSNVESD